MINIERSFAKIRVIGVGGGGGNAVNSMITRGIPEVDFMVANTDKQALAQSIAPTLIQIGENKTNGLGAGADPEKGKESVLESEKEIRQHILGSDMIFVTAGMGGGTGTGGAPEIARISREAGALVVGIVTKPFRWEKGRRHQNADSGIKELRKNVDGLIVIPNQKLVDMTEEEMSVDKAFERVNDVLYNAVRGIADIITKPGKINVDFADVRAIMANAGDTLMGIGYAVGDHRAIEAVQAALNSPLLDGISIRGSKGVLVNIAGRNVGLKEMDAIGCYLEDQGIEEANCIYGFRNSEEFEEEIMVTVIATGFRKNDVDLEKETSAARKGAVTPNLPFNKEFENAANRSNIIDMPKDNRQRSFQNYYNQDSSQMKPKGTVQLKKFDPPAVSRMNNQNGLKPNNVADDQANLRTFSEMKEEGKTDYERSALIRRMMN
ncbi:MAG: cell division protein FtsZ [Candidatus Kapabacteria bacterium]|nr:cell division protein FtsZ [Candidatus Kapabacteria bacterium]